MTLADVAFLNMGAVILRMSNDPSIPDKFPKLKALTEKVKALPKIAKWIEERPKTDF